MTLESVTPREMHRPVSFTALLFGAAAAPLFWTGQLILGYAVTAQACYPGDHPEAAVSAAVMKTSVLNFDLIAILFSLLGGGVAWFCFVKVGRSGTTADTRSMGRARFLAIWGIFSSLWFLGAILFNTIASMTVPPCAT